MIAPLHLFVNTATHTPKTTAADANGFPVKTDGTTASVACSIQPKSSSEGLDLGRDLGKRQAVMYYAPGPTIGIGDTVTLGSDVWRVSGPPRDVGGRGVYNEIDLEVEV